MFNLGVASQTIRLTRNIYRNQYAGSSLGLLWVLIHPFFFLTIFILVFSRIMGARLPGDLASPYAYGIYLSAGFFPWLAFSNTIRRQSTVLLEERAVLAGMPVKLRAFMLSIVLSETINYAVTLMFIGLFLLFIGHPLTWIFLALIPLMIIQEILAAALGIFSAIATIFLRDTRELVNICLQIWFWLTPIVYVLDILPPDIRKIILLNPITHYTGKYQSIILYRRFDYSSMDILMFTVPCILLIISLCCLGKYEKAIRDRL